MTAGFGHLVTCADLGEAEADAACASREDFEALLARLAEISAPNSGVASIFIALGRLASNACDWVDGDLAIELVGADDTTEVRVMTELGMGMRELLFSPFVLRAPLSELAAVLERKPALVGALKVHRRSWKRVTLDATAQIRHSTRPPRISDASLVAVRAPSGHAPPRTDDPRAPAKKR